MILNPMQAFVLHEKPSLAIKRPPQNYGLVTSHHFSQFCGVRFSERNVFRAKQMLAMDSESCKTPSLTPHMLLKADFIFVFFSCIVKLMGPLL